MLARWGRAGQGRAGGEAGRGTHLVAADAGHVGDHLLSLGHLAVWEQGGKGDEKGAGRTAQRVRAGPRSVCKMTLDVRVVALRLAHFGDVEEDGRRLALELDGDSGGGVGWR